VEETESPHTTRTCRLSFLLLLFNDSLLLAFLLQSRLVAVLFGLVHPLVGNLDGNLSVTHLEALQLLDGLLLCLLVLDFDKGETLAPPGSTFSLSVNVVVAGLGDDLAGFRSDGEGCESFGQRGVVNREREVGNEEQSLEDESISRC
jgi:hypothetical protein